MPDISDTVARVAAPGSLLTADAHDAGAVAQGMEYWLGGIAAPLSERRLVTQQHPMLAVLLASRVVKGPRTVGPFTLSVTAHAGILFALIGPALLGKGGDDPSLREPAPNLLVQFLVPPDRSSALAEEHIGYVGLPATGADKGQQVGKPEKVDEKADAGTPVVPQQAANEQRVDGVTQLEQTAQAVGAFSIVDVDSAAIRDPNSAAPSYPKELEKKGIEGFATMRFVVDTTGLIDLGTIALLDASHPGFAKAVRDAMPRMRFRPAMMGAHAVRQLAEQMFKFEIRNQAPSVPGKPVPKPHS